MTTESDICQRLLEFAYDELDPAQAERFAAHLAACARCSTELEGIRRVRRAIPLALPQVEPPGSEARLMEAAERHRPRRRRLVMLARVASHPAYSAAACLVVLSGVLAFQIMRGRLGIFRRDVQEVSLPAPEAPFYAAPPPPAEASRLPAGAVAPAAAPSASEESRPRFAAEPKRPVANDDALATMKKAKRMAVHSASPPAEPLARRQMVAAKTADKAEGAAGEEGEAEESAVKGRVVSGVVGGAASGAAGAPLRVAAQESAPEREAERALQAGRCDQAVTLYDQLQQRDRRYQPPARIRAAYAHCLRLLGRTRQARETLDSLKAEKAVPTAEPETATPPVRAREK